MIFAHVKPMIGTLALRRALRGSVLRTAAVLAVVAAPATHADDATATMDISQFAFAPATLQVPVGTTVTWTNNDAIIHSVTNGTPAEPAGAFDSGFFDQGGTFSFTFNDAGDYAYFCKRHNFMQGTISVTTS